MQQQSMRKQLIIFGGILAAGLLLLVGYAVVQANSLQFNDMSPSKIGTQTNVVFTFSQPITNPQEVSDSLKLSPNAEVTVVVDKTTITLIPVDGFKSTTYTVSVPMITSQQGKLANFTKKFTASDKNPSENEQTTVDLDDIATKQYPKLAQLADENASANFRLQYVFDGKKVIFSLYLIEPLDVTEDESNPYIGLITSDKQAREYIDSLGVPKDKYEIDYSSDIQEQIVRDYSQ